MIKTVEQIEKEHAEMFRILKDFYFSVSGHCLIIEGNKLKEFEDLVIKIHGQKLTWRNQNNK